MERDLELYRLLLLTRSFEERVAKLHAQNKILGGIYSGRGQEAVAVGTAYGLSHEDFVFPLHRDLGVFLAKGIEPRLLMAQLFGKANGLSRGKDSFLHGGLLELGIYGATSMLGSTLPVACGVALKQKLHASTSEQTLCVAYFGEGAASRGDIHEAMNFAALQKLPLLFVCENNAYAFSTPVSRQMAIDSVADRATAYGMPGASCNGNDLSEVCATIERARERARTGGGPTLIECRTYRIEGHSAHDRAAYREHPDEALALWRSRDPILQWERYLEARGHDLAPLRERLSEELKNLLDEAIAFAEQSPEPTPEEALRDLYATYVPGTPVIHAERSDELARESSPAPPEEAMIH